MRKLIAHLETGFCGSDTYEALLVEDTTTEDEINSIVYEMAKNNAEGFGIYPTWEYQEQVDQGLLSPEELDAMEDNGDLSDDIGGSYEDYVPEKHDMLRSGGGSFEEDFEEDSEEDF